MTELDNVIKKRNDEIKAHRPGLDRQLTKVQIIHDRITLLKSEKEQLLLGMTDKLDHAMLFSHTLPNGFHVKPDDKRKVHITSISEFMIWLKTHKQPHEVLDFLVNAMKITELKKFCEKEYNTQREAGVIDPKIDGIRYGVQTFTRLTTEYKAVK